MRQVPLHHSLLCGFVSLLVSLDCRNDWKKKSQHLFFVLLFIRQVNQVSQNSASCRICKQLTRLIAMLINHHFKLWDGLNLIFTPFLAAACVLCSSRVKTANNNFLCNWSTTTTIISIMSYQSGGVVPPQPNQQPLQPIPQNGETIPNEMLTDRNKLIQLINQWNENRLDMFALSFPNAVSVPIPAPWRSTSAYSSLSSSSSNLNHNTYYTQDLEFFGVMRFYYQDEGQKVATKCIRVSSTASASDCIGTLIEKFRPDIRMLTAPDYALYEVHENGGNCLIQINHRHRQHVCECQIAI